jgi:hypothetical protein
MITDDQGLKATLDRIRHFQAQVARLRQMETNELNYHLAASGFSAEVGRMEAEVREYLGAHIAQVDHRGHSPGTPGDNPP